MMDADEYNTGLQRVADAVVIILNTDWQNIRLPLIKKAAKFLIREAIIKRDLTRDAHKIFPNNVEACSQFYAELCEPANPSVQYSNLDIGRYCTALFLVHDWCTGRHLYTDIKAQVQIITDGRFSIDEIPPSFEDYLKESDNSAQNTKANFICRLNKYLSCVIEYLKAEGFFESETFGFHKKTPKEPSE